MPAATANGRPDLARLLRPRSIAVVGATETPGAYSNQTILNLRSLGFDGEIVGVNPKRTEVLGLPCVPSVAELPFAADAVVVGIPAAAVPEVIEQAGARGCGGAVVFSAGFAESAAGGELQRDLLAAATRHDLPVVGPNCNGIVAMHARTALWGDALDPLEPGAVALVSQSGNVAVNAINARRGLRFHTVIASGNQAVLKAPDYLHALAREHGVRAIAMYLEDDGGPDLCDGLADCIDAGIPVVVLKVGHTEAGARAANAHSAALAGDQRVFRALIEDAGAVWAHDVHELLELAKALATRRRIPAGRGLAIMTCSGGDSAQGADEASLHGLELPRFAADTQARLAEILPSAATVANPLDYTALIWGEVEALRDLIRASGEDPSIDQVLVFYDQPAGMTGAPAESWRAVREGIMAGAEVSPVPTLVSSTLPELLDDAAAWWFAEGGVATAAGLRTGIRCAAAMATAAADHAHAERMRAIADAARAAAASSAQPGEWLAEHEAKELLRRHGLATVEGRRVAGAEDAARALRELGGPIALKLSSRSIQHKSELGALELGLDDPARVEHAYRRLRALADRIDPDAAVLAERMADPGTELLIAAHTDGIVPALVVGLGGIWTEVLDDVAVVPLPADADRVERALRGLRGTLLLTGARGSEAADIGAVAELAARAGELLLSEGLELLELNPVFVARAGAGAIVVDAVARRA